MELTNSKINSNLSKIFVLRQFNMAAHQIKFLTLEQRSVIKFWAAEKCKPCEIYRRDMYGEACFSLKKLKFSENVWVWVEKSVLLSLKENVSGAAISKEGHTDCQPRRLKSPSLLETNSVYLLNDPRIQWLWFKNNHSMNKSINRSNI